MIKRLLINVFLALYRILLPEKYYDEIYFNKFLHTINLNRLKLRTKIWCFKHGFLPYEFNVYDLIKNDHRKYIPARNNYQKRLINDSFNPILANKLIFETHMKAIVADIPKLHVVESIGFIEKGFLKSLSKVIVHGEFSSLLPLLERNGLILKPTKGDGGEGLYMIGKENDKFLLNDRITSWEELLKLFKNMNHHVIQEKFKQKGFSNIINPGSVNTMRIATMIDPLTNIPFLAYAVHRFGSSQSGFLDNMSQGGLAAMIDLNDGRLGEAKDLYINGKSEIYQIHPISLKSIYNEQIPGWKSITDRLITLAGKMPYLKYVGWDVILSDDDLYVLEGNVSPGLGIVQIFKPMSDFPAAWDFFRYHKYI